VSSRREHPTCAHCGRPARGSAAIFIDGIEITLCHPDVGLDCYHLVTVYKERIGARRGSL
jgi:hypothetical protein